MACSVTLGGLARDCSNGIGGIKKVYIANFDDVTATTSANGVVTAITMSSGKKFFVYNLRPQTATLSKTLNRDTANGTGYVQSVLTLNLGKMSATTRAEIAALATGDLVVVVEDNNGTKWYLGRTNPVLASGGESTTGQSYTDANKYTIELTDVDPDYPYVCTATPAT